MSSWVKRAAAGAATQRGSRWEPTKTGGKASGWRAITAETRAPSTRWPAVVARLFGYFRRRGLDAEDAEDLTLKVLARLAGTKDDERRSSRFDPDRPFAPFVLTLARHAAIEKWRERKVETVGPPHPDVCAEEAGPLSEQALEDLFVCIEALPEPERAYVRLCGKHGLGESSHQEIAQQLGKWPAQVTEISQRARRAAAGRDGGKGLPMNEKQLAAVLRQVQGTFSRRRTRRLPCRPAACHSRRRAPWRWIPAGPRAGRPRTRPAAAGAAASSTTSRRK